MNLLKSKILPLVKKARRKLVNFSVFVKFKTKRGKKFKNNNGAEHDYKLVHSLSRSKIPSWKQFRYLKKFLSSKELWIIRGLIVFIFLNLGFLGFNFYQNNLEVVPVIGGEYKEGVVGSPKHINPLYADINDVDRDISSLIFSSLFKWNSKGELRKDLVEDIQVSDNQKIYSLTLKKDVFWHNNKKLTAEDVVFTFNAIKNKEYQSPLRSDFAGVEINQTGKYELEFILSQPYHHFLSLLTFGIIPQEQWAQVPPGSANLAEFNLEPIGSGPYKFDSYTVDKLGNIRSYNLTLNKKYYNKKPYIEDLSFQFFVNFTEAINSLNQHEIDAVSTLPLSHQGELMVKNSINTHNLDILQVKSVFFNQENNPALKTKEVREALAYSLNRESLIAKALQGKANPAFSFIPQTSEFYNPEVKKYAFDLSKAKKLLEEADWQEAEITEEEINNIKNLQRELEQNRPTSTATSTEDADEEEQKTLTPEQEQKLILGPGKWRFKKTEDEEERKNYLIIVLSVLENEINNKAVNIIKEQWEEAGVKTVLNMIPTSEFQSRIVNSKNFQALFYGQLIGRNPDSYAFWHSSQSGSGGLNISKYKNEEVDKLLEQSRATSSPETMATKTKQIQETITSDVPAVFIYSPVYIYPQAKKVKGFEANTVSHSKDRFLGIQDWYLKQGKKIIWQN